MNQYDLSWATRSNLHIPVPDGKVYKDYQCAGIFYLLWNPYINTLIGDEPGLGKTIQAIGLMNFIKSKGTLIVVPASLLTNWEREIEAWSTRKLKIQKILTGKDVINHNANVLIISYSLLIRKEIFAVLKKLRYDIMILDEVHLLKNLDAKRSRAILGRLGIGGLKLRAKRVICLSGTPVPNRPIELYPILRSLCPEAIKNSKGGVMSYDEYGFQYCAGYYDIAGQTNFSGASNLRELGRKLREKFMVRRLKKDVLKDLPPKELKIVYLNTTNQIQNLVDVYADFNIDSIINKNIAIDYEGISTMRRELGELKAPIAIEYIKTKLDSGHKKIVIFAHHKSVIKLLEEGLAEYNVVSIKGSTTKKKRQENVDAFQNDPSIRVFVGSILASGIGLTLTAAKYGIVVEPDWQPGVNEQAADRLHRIGQLFSVLIEFLVIFKSLDERILRRVMEKNEKINQLMN